MSKQTAGPLTRLRERRAAYFILLANSVFSGLTSVAIPIELDGVGLGKKAIAAFFVVGAAVAVTYNLGLLPRLARHDYPAAGLRATTLAVPIGTLIVWGFSGEPALLYLGGAVMLAVTTTIPQVFGRVARSGADDPEAVVVELRQVMVAGFILGLGMFSLASSIGIDPLVTAAAVAATASAASWSPFFERPLTQPSQSTAPPSEGQRRTTAITALICAVVLVGLMKSVDTLRSIYLPLYAVHAGFPPSVIAPLFLGTAAVELLVLPLLGRASSRFGPSRVLAGAATLGCVTFIMLSTWQSYLGILTSQLLYSVFGVGFQSVGMVLLARATGRDVGRGAAVFMAVIQVGTVLGAVLPLLVTGYDSAIFMIAAIMCAICVALAVAPGHPQGFDLDERDGEPE